MNLYKIDSGAIYYIAASSMGDAVAAAWAEWPEVDDPAAIEDTGFSVERVDRKDWPDTFLDDGEGKKMPFAPLVEGATKAAILTCSEWP